MADKKENKPAAAVATKVYNRVYILAVVIVGLLSGLSLGWWVMQHYVNGKYVAGGIGNSFSAQPLFFPDNGKKLQAILVLLRSSKSEILLMADTISSKEMVDTIAERANSGIRTYIILSNGIASGDMPGGLSPVAHYMLECGITEVFVDAIPSTNQVIIVDNRYVIVGNGGFSTRAEADTAGSLVVVESMELAAKFKEYFIGRGDTAKKLILAR